eukprot:jgi/Ulvmu1/11162/UM071_0046.1
MGAEADKNGSEFGKNDYDVTEHLMSAAEVASKYATDINQETPSKSGGLKSSEATKRLEENGPNKLSPPKDKPEWLKYLLQYTNPLLFLLIIAGVLTFVAYAIQDPKDQSNIILGVVLFLVIILLATTQYMNERAAGSVAAQLRNLLPSNANVIRDGKETQLSAVDLVVGDMVHMTIGSRVPADIKVLESRDLKLDFSALTGESDPIAMATSAADDKPHESKHIAFMSSQVLNGEGYGVVIRCGDNTFIGKINSLAAQTTSGETTLQRDINMFVKVIAVIAISMAIVLFSAGMGRKMDFADAFVNGLVVVLVANIPQGLPATVTSALTLTAERMKDVSVLVKKTDIIEALGSATRIASDKTGTLTQNKMTVMNCWVNRQYKSANEIVHSVVRPGAAAMAMRKRHSMHRASNASGGRVSAGRATVEDIDLKLPPSAQAGASGAPRTPSGGSSRFGTDMLSRMSMGKASVGSANVGKSLGKNTLMTFALNVTTAVPDHGDGSLWSTFSPLSKLITIASVNNKAQFEGDADPEKAAQPGFERRVLGDATDSGLLRFCDKIMDVDDVRAAFSSVFSIPFNSKNKWALNMVRMPGDADNYLVLIKGAPEYVIKKCGRYFYRDHEHVLDDDFVEDMMEAYQSFGTLAERVIGHAFKVVPAGQLPTSEEEAEAMGFLDDFSFCGLLSLIDPPRDAVPPAVASCRSAGVGVTMVTGDHPLTAEAIARKCGIITLPTRREVAAELGVEETEVPFDNPDIQALVITGSMIPDLKTEKDWDVVMSKEELVFARTTPQQKLQIVDNFQRRKEIVAVTGDGVNDSPALRKADIGVAMGNPDSSEVAREAADVVLLDDDFASLVAAITEGRVLYDNLKKTIAYTLAHIPPETFPVILALAFGMPLGLGSLLVLSIDLITEQGPATSLAYEPAEANVMARPPRDIAVERLVSIPLLTYSYIIVGLAESLCCMGAYLWVFKHRGVSASDIFLLDPKDEQWFSDAERISEDPDKIVTIDGEIYTPETQERIVRESNGAWYITLIMCQFWHIWFCKTRRVSVFKHPGLYENRITYYGVFVALAVMILCTYVPWLQDNVFFTANPPGVQAWVPHFFFLAFIAIYTEGTKAFARKNPNAWFTKWFVW